MIIKKFKKYDLAKLTFFLFLFIGQTVYSQNDNIPIREPVYNFLKRMQVQGVIDDFDDSVLPITRHQVVHLLIEIYKNKSSLDETDIQYLNFQIRKYDLNQSSISVFDSFPEQLINNLLSDSSKNVYKYKKNDYLLVVNPIFRYKYIYDGRIRNNSNLIEFGGEVYGGYQDWLGFYIFGTNGLQLGSRKAALHDEVVRHSYTFNETERNNFDFSRLCKTSWEIIES